ncbi:MAG TPA: TonB-dependent receptor [Elusimicrobiota bacterium]|nr:TonB-dependent receptor [Elusimicrobiota bacterium]
MVTGRSAALAALLVVLSSASRAADSGAEPVFKFFQEEANATTALRRAAPIDRSPLAVDVITAEEIKASGALNVWDILRFRVGMDVIEGRSDGGADRAVVSVRGIPRDSVTELQVLIDGRSVYSPLNGGVLWEQLPVQIQDIERIEIVRGPNAALYGSNAGTGVINIITRRPSKDFEASATGMGGTQDFRQGQAAVETAKQSWGARLSGSDRAQDGFPKADGTGAANDWLREQKMNFRSWFAVGSRTDLEALAGVVKQGHGVNMTNDPQAQGLDHFQALHATHGFDGGSTLEARVSRTDDDIASSPDINGVLSDTRYWQYDAEAFHSIPWADGRLRTTYGSSWRYASARSNTIFGPDAGNVTNRSLRGFMHQEIQVTDSVSLLGGVSLETDNIGGFHKDFQVASLWSPLEDQSFRASYARANTTPGLLSRYAQISFPVGGGVSGSLAGNPSLNPSPLTDYEAGWTGRFLDRAVAAEFTGYYMYIQDHVNIDVDANAALPGSVFAETYDNTNTVELRGMEASLKWRFAPGRSAYANYTRETVTDQDHHSLYINTTPKNKFNAGVDLALPERLRLSANAGYKDAYLADSNTGTAQDVIPAYWRLDARLGWQATPKLELFVAGQNLLAASRREYIDGLVVPRMIEGGMTLRY